MIIRFPFRAVFVVRERDDEGWLVVAGDHAWLHGDFSSALRNAGVIAKGFALTVLSSAGAFAP